MQINIPVILPSRDNRSATGTPEVFLPSSGWLSVCGDVFTDITAAVVCQQLGYPVATMTRSVPNADHSRRTVQFECDGNEGGMLARCDNRYIEPQDSRCETLAVVHCGKYTTSYGSEMIRVYIN